MPKHIKEVYHCPHCANYVFHCGPGEFKAHLRKHGVLLKVGESLQRFRSPQTATRMRQGIEKGKKP